MASNASSAIFLLLDVFLSCPPVPSAVNTLMIFNFAKRMLTTRAQAALDDQKKEEYSPQRAQEGT